MATIHLPTRAIKLSAADNQMRIPDATGRLWIVRLARSNASASRRSLVYAWPSSDHAVRNGKQFIVPSAPTEAIKFSSQAVLSVAHHPPEVASILVRG